MASACIAAHRKNVAPMRQSCAGRWLAAPRIEVPTSGMTIMPMLEIDCKDPISSPCSLAADDFEMIDCRAGPAANASRLQRMNTYIIQPWVASPYSR